METVISIVTLEWVHDRSVVYLVAIDLTLYGEPGMKFRNSGTDFSDSDIRWEKAIQGSMDALQALVVERCNKMSHLKI